MQCLTLSLWDPLNGGATFLYKLLPAFAISVLLRPCVSNALPASYTKDSDCKHSRVGSFLFDIPK